MRYFARKIGVLPRHPVGRGDPELPHPAAAARGPGRDDGQNARRQGRPARPGPGRRRCGPCSARPTGSLWSQYVGYLRPAAARQLRGVLHLLPVPGDRGDRPGVLVDGRPRHASPRCSRSSSASLLGAYAAWRRNTRFDTVVTLGSTFLGTLQPFWIALLLLYVFGYTARLVPDPRRLRGVDPGLELAPSSRTRSRTRSCRRCRC